MGRDGLHEPVPGSAEPSAPSSFTADTGAPVITGLENSVAGKARFRLASEQRANGTRPTFYIDRRGRRGKYPLRPAPYCWLFLWLRAWVAFAERDRPYVGLVEPGLPGIRRLGRRVQVYEVAGDSITAGSRQAPVPPTDQVRSFGTSGNRDAAVLSQWSHHSEGAVVSRCSTGTHEQACNGRNRHCCTTQYTTHVSLLSRTEEMGRKPTLEDGISKTDPGSLRHRRTCIATRSVARGLANTAQSFE